MHFTLCICRTMSYYYYLDQYKYLGMHVVKDDILVSKFYGVLCIASLVFRCLSGLIFQKLGLRKFNILNFSLILVYEFVFFAFGQHDPTMFLVTMLLIGAFTGCSSYCNNICIYALYETPTAIQIVCYFETYFLLGTIITSILNYFFEHQGNIQPIILILATCEGLCLFYCIFFLKE